MKIELREWLRSAHDAAKRQAVFVLEDVLPLVGAGLDYEDYRDGAVVIGEHMSKSVCLPVYEMRREDLGLRLVMRNNFHDWKLSVDSARPIVERNGFLSSLFHTTPPVERGYTGDDLAKVYFEGFRCEDIFGYHCGNQGQWSACVRDDYRMWATVFYVMRELEVVKPLVWHTRASHAAEIEAQRERRERRTGASS